MGKTTPVETSEGCGVCTVDACLGVCVLNEKVQRNEHGTDHTEVKGVNDKIKFEGFRVETRRKGEGSILLGRLKGVVKHTI